MRFAISLGQFDELLFVSSSHNCHVRYQLPADHLLSLWYRLAKMVRRMRGSEDEFDYTRSNFKLPAYFPYVMSKRKYLLRLLQQAFTGQLLFTEKTA